VITAPQLNNLESETEMQTQTVTFVAPVSPTVFRSTAVSLSRRASRLPILRGVVNRHLAARELRLDLQRQQMTRVEIAHEKLADIRFNALARYTKRGLISYLSKHLDDEFAIDRLGELAIDLEGDIAIAMTLRDGRAIRKMLRSKL